MCYTTKAVVERRVNTRLYRLAVRTSYPLRKALIMLFRGERSERISLARTMTEDKAHLTLSELSPLTRVATKKRKEIIKYGSIV